VERFFFFYVSFSTHFNPEDSGHEAPTIVFPLRTGVFPSVRSLSVPPPDPRTASAGTRHRDSLPLSGTSILKLRHPFDSGRHADLPGFASGLLQLLRHGVVLL